MCMSDADPNKPRHTGEVDDDGFCQDLMAVQGMSGAMIARQVSVRRSAIRPLQANISNDFFSWSTSTCVSAPCGLVVAEGSLFPWSGEAVLAPAQVCLLTAQGIQFRSEEYR